VRMARLAAGPRPRQLHGRGPVRLRVDAGLRRDRDPRRVLAPGRLGPLRRRAGRRLAGLGGLAAAAVRGHRGGRGRGRHPRLHHGTAPRPAVAGAAPAEDPQAPAPGRGVLPAVRGDGDRHLPLRPVGAGVRAGAGRRREDALPPVRRGEPRRCAGVGRRPAGDGVLRVPGARGALHRLRDRRDRDPLVVRRARGGAGAGPAGEARRGRRAGVGARPGAPAGGRRGGL
ncbi:MAG: DedA protein, partial [uncultured Quadrisphaera sp.]